MVGMNWMHALGRFLSLTLHPFIFADQIRGSVEVGSTFLIWIVAGTAGGIPIYLAGFDNYRSSDLAYVAFSFSAALGLLLLWAGIRLQHQHDLEPVPTVIDDQHTPEFQHMMEGLGRELLTNLTIPDASKISTLDDHWLVAVSEDRGFFDLPEDISLGIEDLKRIVSDISHKAHGGVGKAGNPNQAFRPYRNEYIPRATELQSLVWDWLNR